MNIDVEVDLRLQRGYQHSPGPLTGQRIKGSAHTPSGHQRVRAVIATTVGSSVEWYDFFLYGSGAALIFPKLTRRGFFSSWAHVGLPVGLALGNSALLIANSITGPDFLTMGWRYPFVLSLVLIVIGIWVRLGVLETPIFVRLLEERRIARQPVRQVVTSNGGDIVKLVFVKVVEMSSFYVFTVFVLSYGTKTLKLGSEFMLLTLWRLQ